MAAAELLDGATNTTRHTEAVNTAQARVLGDQETPSARVIRELNESQIDYSTLMGKYSEQWNQRFRETAIPQNIRTHLADEAIASLRKQREIENSDASTFDAFLHAFYAQYRL